MAGERARTQGRPRVCGVGREDVRGRAGGRAVREASRGDGCGCACGALWAAGVADVAQWRVGRLGGRRQVAKAQGGVRGAEREGPGLPVAGRIDGIGGGSKSSLVPVVSVRDEPKTRSWRPLVSPAARPDWRSSYAIGPPPSPHTPFGRPPRGLKQSLIRHPAHPPSHVRVLQLDAPRRAGGDHGAV